MARPRHVGGALGLSLALSSFGTLACDAEARSGDVERTPPRSAPAATEPPPPTTTETMLEDAIAPEPGPNPDLEVQVDDRPVDAFDAAVRPPNVHAPSDAGTTIPHSNPVDSGANSPPGTNLVDSGEPMAAFECDDALDAFADARDEAAKLSEFYDCRVHEDCANIHPCDRSDNCGFRAILNVEARQSFAVRITSELCECFDERFVGCPEPEAAVPSCLEGVCTAGIDAEDPTPPESCEDHVDSFGRLTRQFNNSSLGMGCDVVGVGNGCTGGECRYFPVSVRNVERYRAMLDAHLRFNDCSECGDPVDCSMLPRVVDDGSRCWLEE